MRESIRRLNIAYEEYKVMPTSVLLNALLLASLLALSQGILKWVASKPSDSLLGLFIEYWFAISVSIFIYLIIFVYYIYILRLSKIAILYPVYTSLSIILVFLMGRYYFSETVNSLQLLGCFLITAGVVLVVMK